MLLDSNIIIYLCNGSASASAYELVEKGVCVSEISMLETLGYHRIRVEEIHELNKFFNDITRLSIYLDIIERAIALRQQKNISLGDSIIAATALEHDLTLCTRNVADFKWIDGLKIVNPFED